MSTDELFEFPCRFPIKVMGERHDAFVATVLSVVQQHAPQTGEADIQIKESTKGRYLSLTVTVDVTSREQLEDLYRALSGHEMIKAMFMSGRIVKHLGLVDYLPIWQAMQTFTDTRTADTVDELWLVEHPPVYTLGMAGKPEHILRQTEIPLVNIDRGGQVTYHGPGQLVVYLLIDFKRLGLGVRELVRRIEQSVVDTLACYGVAAHGDDKAPGVYVGAEKIASLGLRIKNGAVYHGLSLNVDMDLTPFTWINPCGYAGLAVTQMKNLTTEPVSVLAVADRLLPQINKQLDLPGKPVHIANAL